MKCFFCGGAIRYDPPFDRCIMCGKSMDVEYEEKVKKLQAKEHLNWHSYHGLSANKRGRKSKWEE